MTLDIGVKYDNQKPRMDLIPPEAMNELATILTYGAGKYADHNWRKGLHYSRVYAAALRHLLAFWSGENLDPESGLSHLSHALCNVAFLVTYERTGTGTDDRFQYAKSRNFGDFIAEPFAKGDDHL